MYLYASSASNGMCMLTQQGASDPSTPGLLLKYCVGGGVKPPAHDAHQHNIEVR